MHEHVPSLAARDALCIWYNTAAFEDTATNIKNGADSSKNVQLFLERWEKIETTYAKSMDELLDSRISHMNKNTAAGISCCFTAPHVCIVQRVQLWLCSLLSPLLSRGHKMYITPCFSLMCSPTRPRSVGILCVRWAIVTTAASTFHSPRRIPH
jgi:hypothetical protein